MATSGERRPRGDLIAVNKVLQYMEISDRDNLLIWDASESGKVDENKVSEGYQKT